MSRISGWLLKTALALSVFGLSVYAGGQYADNIRKVARGGAPETGGLAEISLAEDGSAAGL